MVFISGSIQPEYREYSQKWKRIKSGADDVRLRGFGINTGGGNPAADGSFANCGKFESIRLREQRMQYLVVHGVARFDAVVVSDQMSAGKINIANGIQYLVSDEFVPETQAFGIE